MAIFICFLPFFMCLTTVPFERHNLEISSAQVLAWICSHLCLSSVLLSYVCLIAKKSVWKI